MGCVRLRQQVNVDRVRKTVSLRNGSAQAEVKDPELTLAQEEDLHVAKNISALFFSNCGNKRLNNEVFHENIIYLDLKCLRNLMQSS